MGEVCSLLAGLFNHGEVALGRPGGVEHGSQLRLSGEGDAGSRGGPPGDLYVVLHVKQHKLFERDGYNLLLEIPISFTQAALGDNIDVPLLVGMTSLTIPAGVQTGTVLRVKGEGVPHLQQKGRGDLLVRVRLITPRSLDPEARHLFEELAERLSSSEDAHEDKGWFDRVKETLGGAHTEWRMGFRTGIGS